ncbi:MAG: tetratricopeptide repeat protein [Bryobacterales bacterium]|nr:tetratricopeptide repeat protein [Bryobacterales bacterium]
MRSRILLGLLLAGAAACAEPSWEKRVAAADALQKQGRYREAIDLYREADGQAQRAGAAGPRLARALNNFGAACYYLGRYSDAEPLYRRALDAWGDDAAVQRDRAFTLNNLASLYRAQGRYREAEAAHLSAGEILEKSRGESWALDFGTHLNNLAELYRVEDRLAEAEEAARRSVETLESALGPQHPGLARSLSTLGAVNRYLGRYDQAEALYRRALWIQERALKDQSSTANTLINLAELYALEKRYAEAGRIATRALNLYIGAFGLEHPGVAVALNNLAQIAKHEGRGAEAESLYRRCLEVAARTLGESHPDYARYTGNLADLYAKQGRFRAAEVLYGRALAVLKDSLSARHPETAGMRARLGEVYMAQNRAAEARRTLKALRP